MNTKLSNKETAQRSVISIEEFDLLSGEHEFSEEYRDRKKQVLTELKEREQMRVQNRTKKIAAAIVLTLVAVPTSVYAASTHADFFDSMFGNSTKDNIAAHDVEIEGNDAPVTVTLPEREYVPVDQEEAEELIGDEVKNEPIVKQLGDHTLTIESVVADRRAAFVTFTLEREGGVTMLAGDESTNESKGAYFTDEAEYFFNISGRNNNGGGKIYVDLEKSTPEKLYCSIYVVAADRLDEGASAGFDLSITHYPCKLGEMKGMSEEEYKEKQIEANITTTKISLYAESRIQPVVYTSKTGGYMEVSPLSLWFDMAKGLGLSYSENMDEYSEACDSANIKKIEIKYKDGSSYLVYDIDANIDNSGYICGSTGTDLGIAFNRLINPDEISGIVINETEYHQGE